MKLNTTIRLLLLTMTALAIGCSRAGYRLRADRDAMNLIGRDTQDPRWALPNYSIQPKVQSRMYDPSDPDRPPMPMDDPASYEIMQRLGGKKGFPGTQPGDEVAFVENPVWTSFVPMDEEGNLRMDLRTAVAAALLNSPDYQQQLEELYLSALDVSFEEFRFDTQFFGGYESFFTSIGPDRSDGPSNELRLSTRMIEARKRFAAGGELVVGLANSLIWEYTGTNHHTAFTLLDFSLVQPLLRGAGRARVMERLTLSQRTLLANVRAMERFRHGFYAEIAAGIDAGGGPSRRGGLAGGAGLEGFTGVGAGGFGRLGNVTSGGRGGTGAGQAGGFLGLLQEAQGIRNLQSNVAALRRSLAELQALYQAGGRIDFFQVELARQALYNAQSRLLTRRADFKSSLDAFKIELGLPPDLPVVLNDPRLDRFNLIDQQLADAQSFAADLLNVARDPNVNLVGPSWTELVDNGRRLLQMVNQQVEVARRDVERFHENLPARRESLRRLAERPELKSGEVELESFDVRRLDTLYERAQTALAQLTQRYTDTAVGLDLIQAPADRADLTKRLTELSAQLADLLLLQARARLEAVVLTDVELDSHTALAIARDRRLDWMNARAALVDSWRLINFNANDLKSNLDVVFEGELQNVGDNPFKLQGKAGLLRAGLQFDAPSTRLAERNVYRQALIEYQQARRNYYTYVDRVNQGLRGTLRNIELNQLNFEMRRAAVQLAISQVELAGLQIQEPPKPGVEFAGSDNRVQNLVNALTELLSAQDDFLSIWVNYEVLRLSLDFNLGTMQLDRFGQWLDPGPITADRFGHVGEQIPAPEVIDVGEEVNE